MGASCNLLQSSLADLRQKKLTNDIRIIPKERIWDFDNYNLAKTRIAKKLYNVPAQFENQNLYTTIKMKGFGNYIAEPNHPFFNAIQKLKEESDIRVAVQPVTVANLDNSHPVKEYWLKNDDYSERDAVTVPVIDFLDATKDKKLFNLLNELFEKNYDRVFEPDVFTTEARRSQMYFYKLIALKGYKGFVMNNRAYAFNFDINAINAEMTALEESVKPVQLSLFDTVNDEVVPASGALNELEKLRIYSGREMAKLKELYSDAEINQMVLEDLRDATEQFNDYLYNEDSMKVVPSQMVNDFNRICR
jgi:hypothetical protein